MELRIGNFDNEGWYTATSCFSSVAFGVSLSKPVCYDKKLGYSINELIGFGIGCRLYEVNQPWKRIRLRRSPPRSGKAALR
jgi:hypothetical protein